MPRPLPGGAEGLGEPVGGQVARGEGARPPPFHHLLQRADGLGHRHARVVDVGVEEVDVVGAQAAQAVRRLIEYRLAAEPERVVRARARPGGPGADLRREHDPVPAPARDPLAEAGLRLVADRSGLPERVVVRGVDEPGAAVDGPVEQVVRRLTGHPRAPEHRADRQRRHVQGPQRQNVHEPRLDHRTR